MEKWNDQLISSSLPSDTGKVDDVATLLVQHIRKEGLWWDLGPGFTLTWVFKTAPWSSKSEPARWPQKSSQSWFCTESHSLKISLKRDLASGVSSSAVPDTIPALFTRILTVPTWKYWVVPLRCTPPGVVICPLLGKLLLVIIPQILIEKNPENFQNHRHKGAATEIKGDATPFLLNYKIFNISKTRQKLEIFVHQNTRSPRPRTVIIVTLFFFVKFLFITTCWLFKSAAKKSLVTNYPFQ